MTHLYDVYLAVQVVGGSGFRTNYGFAKIEILNLDADGVNKIFWSISIEFSCLMYLIQFLQSNLTSLASGTVTSHCPEVLIRMVVTRSCIREVPHRSSLFGMLRFRNLGIPKSYVDIRRKMQQRRR